MLITKKLLAQLLISAGFTGSQVPTMICIAEYESSFRTNVVNVNKNTTIDYGLFQINDHWWLNRGKDGCSESVAELLTARGNVNCAKKVFDTMGFKAWVAYKNKAQCSGRITDESQE